MASLIQSRHPTIALSRIALQYRQKAEEAEEMSDRRNYWWLVYDAALTLGDYVLAELAYRKSMENYPPENSHIKEE